MFWQLVVAKMLSIFGSMWAQLVVVGPHQEARQPELGPLLDFEKEKTTAAAAARWWSGRHYGVLACQKSTVAALSTQKV